MLGFAERLLSKGHEVMVSVGEDPRTVDAEGASGLERLRVQRHEFRGRWLSPETLDGARTFRPSVIHAFNSRHAVVAAASAYARATGAPVCVHFEDDEWGLARGAGRAPGRRLVLAARRAAGAIHPPSWRFSSRTSLRWVARKAAAVDALFPALAEHVSERTGRECAAILPLLPPLRPLDRVDPRIEALDPTETPLIVLAGAIYDAHEADARRAMRAVGLVRERGLNARFVHCGPVAPRFDPPAMAREEGLAPEGSIFLGYLPIAAVPSLLERASVLVQPGEPSEFNRLRLPSKLQMYLPSGVPTITFATGFGELLEDGKEVMKTHTGQPGELADRITQLLSDSSLRATLSRHGPDAARRLFDAERNVSALLDYYEAALRSGSGASVVP